MTNIEILQIIIALLIVLGLKYFFSKINKKIDADIEKEKEKEREEKQKKADKEKADKENYWLIKYQRELKETLDAIETRIIQTNEERYDINGEFDCYYNDIFKLAKKLSHFLDKNDKSGDEFHCFDILLRCYYFGRPRLEKDLKDLKLYYREKDEELQQKEQELQQKEQKLELRETRIVKIESAQKILNSELVEKINKEID